MRRITTDSLSNQNIATALLLATYTADADRMLYINVRADQVAGNGDYVVYLTRQHLGAGSHFRQMPQTTATVPSGVTSIAFPSIGLPVKNTDVIKVYLTGLAGDTTTPDTVVEWWEDELFITVGAAGAGLSAVPWNAAWDAEVQSEAADALVAYAPATASALATAQTTLNTIAAYIDTEIQTIITNIAALPAAVWDRATSALVTAGSIGAWILANAGSGASPATFWAYAARTLTQGAASVTAAVTGTSITQYRGTRWSITLTGLTTFGDTTYTSLLFSVKRNSDDADSAAICQVRKNRTGGGDGLTAFENAPTVTAGQASITVNSATSITIVVEGATTQYAEPGTYTYGIKVLDASGYPSMLSAGGVFTVSADVPLAVS